MMHHANTYFIAELHEFALRKFTIAINIDTGGARISMAMPMMY